MILAGLDEPEDQGTLERIVQSLHSSYAMSAAVMLCIRDTRHRPLADVTALAIHTENVLDELENDSDEMDEQAQLQMALLRQAYIRLGRQEALEEIKQKIKLLEQRGSWLLDSNDVPMRCIRHFSASESGMTTPFAASVISDCINISFLNNHRPFIFELINYLSSTVDQ